MSSFAFTTKHLTPKRTVCIGIGSAGHDMLMQIYPRVTQQGQAEQNIPLMSFLSIDEGDMNHALFSTLNSDDPQKILPTFNVINLAAIDSGVKSLNQRNPERLSQRLASQQQFFIHHEKIRVAIRSAVDQVTCITQFKSRDDIECGLEVIVMGSFCEAMGSGIYIDLAYTLRHLLQTFDYCLIGYWTTSPEMYGNTSKMNAYVFAALKELNYYASSQHHNESDQKAYAQTLNRTDDAPFDFIYLLSNTSAHERNRLSRAFVHGLIAQKILLRYRSELASMIREKEKRLNDPSHALEDNFQGPKPQHYLSFGLIQKSFSQTYLTLQDQLILKKKLVNFWRDGTAQLTTSESLLDRFLLKWQLPKGKQEYIFSQLELKLVNEERSFEQAFRIWQENISAQINSLHRREDLQIFLDGIEQQLNLMVEATKIHEHDQEYGDWPLRLMRSISPLRKKLNQDIVQFFEQQLTPSQVSFGLTTATQWLESLRTYLNQSTRHLEQSLNNFHGFHSQDSIKERICGHRQILEDIENTRYFWFARQTNKPEDFQLEAKQILDIVSGMIRHNIDYILIRESVGILHGLEQQIQEILKRLMSMRGILKQLSFNYEQNIAELSQIEDDRDQSQHCIKTQSIPDDFVKVSPNSLSHKNLIRLSEAVLTQLSLNSSFSSLVNRDIQINELNLAINRAIEVEEATENINLKPTATQYLLKNLASSSMNVSFKRILQQSEPLLQIVDRFSFDRSKKALMIGLNQDNKAEFTQLSQLLLQQFGIPSSAFCTIKNTDEIIFLKFHADFPLGSIHGLDSMRQHYQRFYQTAEFSSDEPHLGYPDITIQSSESLPRNQIQEEINLILKHKTLGYLSEKSLQRLRWFREQGDVTEWEFDIYQKQLLA